MSTTQKSIYNWAILDGSDNLVADISLVAQERHFNLQRNREEQLDCTFSLNAVTGLCDTLGLTITELFAPGVNQVRVTRDNRVLLTCRIRYLRPELSGNSPTIELRATGQLDDFLRVYVYDHTQSITTDLTYTGIDISAAAWHLIAEVQARTNGSRNVTQGTLATSRTTDFQFQALSRTVKDALIDLTKLNDSIDVEFTPGHVFNTYYPGMGTVKTDLAFRYPGNIVSLALPIDATQLTTVSFNRGQGNGSAQPIEIRPNPSSGAPYASTDNPFADTYGRQEGLDDYPGVVSATELDAKGDETLRMYANPTTIPEITLDGTQDPPLGAYWMGDWVQFSVDAGPVFAALNGQTWRINEIDVRLDENDAETIKLTVGYA